MSEDVVMYCTFQASGRLFGVALADIKEITAEILCTKIPHAPDCVRGYANIRGQIVLGLDLKRILNLPSADDDGKRLVIFKHAVGPSFGLLVDEIGEIESVSHRDIVSEGLTTGQTSGGPSGLIERVCPLADQLLIVLNPRKFLPIIENALSETST